MTTQDSTPQDSTPEPTDPAEAIGEPGLSYTKQPMQMAASDAGNGDYVSPQRSPRRGHVLPVLSTLAGVLCVMLLMQYYVPHLVREIQYAAASGREQAEVEVATAALKEQPLKGLSAAYQLISKRVGPSVVHINTSQIVEAERRRKSLYYFFPESEAYESRSQGSGVIVDDEGYILTNYHVIQGATEIRVALSDDREFAAKVVGSDPLTDLAVLKIKAKNLIPADWGDSDLLQAGALVWAIGSPFGLDHSITFGILSAKNREGRTGRRGRPQVYHDFLQTDAAVNPGNSGGPLVNAEGEVVGINTAIVGESFRGISFAIPSSIAKQVYHDLKTKGRIARGFLGINMLPVTEQMAPRLGLQTATGVFVERVLADSPAAKAGIAMGDVVLSWNGHEVDDPTAMRRLVAATKVGSKAEVVVVREGNEQTITVTVGENPWE